MRLPRLRRVQILCTLYNTGYHIMYGLYSVTYSVLVFSRYLSRLICAHAIQYMYYNKYRTDEGVVVVHTLTLCIVL